MANIVKVRGSHVETIVECGHLPKGACGSCVIRAFDATNKISAEKGKYMALNNLTVDELTEQDLENIRFNVG